MPILQRSYIAWLEAETDSGFSARETVRVERGWSIR